MTKLTFIFLLFTLLSCTSSKKENAEVKNDSSIQVTSKSLIDSVELPKLYVNYFRDTLYEGMSESDRDSIVVVNTEYFRIPLLKTKSNYLAMNDSSQPLTEKRSVRFLTYVVADYPKYWGPADFNTPQEFLNYMSDRGYEKFTQSKGDEGIIYTFKRRSGNNPYR